MKLFFISYLITQYLVAISSIFKSKWFSISSNLVNYNDTSSDSSCLISVSPFILNGMHIL